LLQSGGLLDRNRQPLDLAADFFAGKNANPRGQNGGFQNRMLGPIEAKKWPQLSSGNDATVNRGPLGRILERLDLEGQPTAGIGQAWTRKALDRNEDWRNVKLPHSGAGQQFDVVGHVECAATAGLQVAVCLRGLKRSQDEASDLTVHARTHGGNIG